MLVFIVKSIFGHKDGEAHTEKRFITLKIDAQSITASLLHGCDGIPLHRIADEVGPYAGHGLNSIHLLPEDFEAL